MRNFDKNWLIAMIVIFVINTIIQLAENRLWAAAVNAAFGGGLAYVYWDKKLRKKL